VRKVTSRLSVFLGTIFMGVCGLISGIVCLPSGGYYAKKSPPAMPVGGGNHS
jgi:hypothetical protein